MNSLRLKNRTLGIQAVIVFLLFFVGTKEIFAATFLDVPPDNPDYSAIESLANLGVVSGYSDGTFKPDQPVSRAEALKMILLTAQVQVNPGLYQTGFPDVKLSDWFSGYVFNAQNLKIVEGNPDGTFAPNRQVDKAEFLKMAEQAFTINLTDYQTIQAPLSTDISSLNDWYISYLNYAESVGIIAPTVDNKLEPGAILSRADCAEILYKMYIIKNGGQTQQLLSTAEAKIVNALVQINQNDLNSALARAQEAVFYTDTAVKQDPTSNVTQAAHSIAQGFENLFEAYGAAAQKNTDQLNTLVSAAESDATQATAQDSSLQALAQKLETLADKLVNS